MMSLISFIKTAWNNLTTPVTPEELNRIEKGIDDTVTATNSALVNDDGTIKAKKAQDADKLGGQLPSHYRPTGGSPGQIPKLDADGNLIWGADNNTTYDHATQTSNGLMSSTDKTKLDGVEQGANKYTHPNSHPPSIIEETPVKQFISLTERQKLASIGDNANNYTHPTGPGNNHIPSGGVANQILGYQSNGVVQWMSRYSSFVGRTTSLTISSAYLNAIILFDNASYDITVTIPASSPTIPDNTEIYIVRNANGNVLFAEEPGAFIISFEHRKRINERSQMVTLKKVSGGTWFLFGDLGA